MERHHDSKPDDGDRPEPREDAAEGTIAKSLPSSGATTLRGRVQVKLTWRWELARARWVVEVTPDAGKPVSMTLRLDEERRVALGADQIAVRHHRATDAQGRAVHVLSVQLPLDQTTAIHRAIAHWSPPAPGSELQAEPQAVPQERAAQEGDA